MHQPFGSIAQPSILQPFTCRVPFSFGELLFQGLLPPVVIDGHSGRHPSSLLRLRLHPSCSSFEINAKGHRKVRLS